MENKHDQDRRDSLVRALAKVIDQADNAKMHLIVNDRDEADIDAMSKAAALVDKALEVLGAKVPG